MPIKNPKTKEKVQVVLFTQNGSHLSLVLFQTNEKRGGFWQNITGSIDQVDHEKAKTGNEHYAFCAAKRELMEESGLKDCFDIFDLNYQFHYSNHKKQFNEYCFLAIINHEFFEAIKIDPKEHQEVKHVILKDVTLKHFGYLSNWRTFEVAQEFYFKHIASLQ